MILAPKHIHKLRKELSQIISDETTARRHCTQAQLQVFKINFRGDAWSMWGNIIGKANIDKVKFAQLLKSIIRDFPNNATLDFYLSELIQSRQSKISTVAEALKNGNCVLLLGPDILRLNYKNESMSFNQYMCQILENQMKEEIVYYDKNLATNLGYLSQCYTDMPQYNSGDLAKLSAENYDNFIKRKQIDEAIYSKLSELPFPLIINANADKLLLKHMEVNKPENTYFEYYDISNNPSDTPKEIKIGVNQISAQNPPTIIYNIFGSFDNPFSVLYSEGQFLDFTNKVILGNPRINPFILNEIYKKQTFIFLGFDFEQWYFKMLFHLFRMKKDQYHAISCTLESDETEEVNNLAFKLTNITKEFFEEEFKMYFVNDEIQNFITDLKIKYDQL